MFVLPAVAARPRRAIVTAVVLLAWTAAVAAAQEEPSPPSKQAIEAGASAGPQGVAFSRQVVPPRRGNGRPRRAIGEEQRGI